MAAPAHRPRAAKPAILPAPQSGTLYAINCSGKSDGTSDSKPPVARWGGARNRRDRTSDALTHHQVAAIIAAGQRALAMGVPFNRHVTIHWERAGIVDADAARATGAIIKLASDWARTRGERIHWAWVRENDDGDGSKGSHVHFLIHSHSELLIGRMWRRWLRKVTGRPYRAGTVRSRTIGPSLHCAITSPAAYAVNLSAVTAYLCKGASRDAADAMGLVRVELGGRVIGKRIGVCQALLCGPQRKTGPNATRSNG